MVDCKLCGKCCKYICIEIDKPTTKSDYNNIIWYLLHENVKIFKHDSDWFVEFVTKCKMLGKDNLCQFYDGRPKICRDHNPRDCENTHGDSYELVFTEVDEFLEYLKKLKKNYKFKSFKK